MLLSPMRTLGISLGLAQRATAAGARAVPDPRPRAADRRAARRAGRCRAGAGRVELRDVDAALRGRRARPRCTTSTLDVAGRHAPSRSSARPARARRRSSQLIPRLYDVTAGAVLVDGADVRDVDVALAARARSRSSTTTRSCSRATRAPRTSPTRAPDATREEIERAARRAQAHDFIARLPDGYDTRVGERGLTLSGGQRQRVAIARALLADPRILDPRRRDVVGRRLDRAGDQGRRCARSWPGRTTFVIAHRLSTISLADEIVVLEDGALVAARHARRAARAVRAVPRDRREGPARPGLPHPQAASSARWRGCDAPATDGRSRRPPAATTCAGACAARSGRGRKLRGLVVLLRALPGARRRSCSLALVAGTAASLAPAPLAKTAIDDGILKGDVAARSTSSSSPFLVSALVVWGATYAQTYLVGWVGQRALRRPAPADLPPPAGDAGRLLRAPARRACSSRA